MARTLSPEISNKGRVVYKTLYIYIYIYRGIWRESFDGKKRLSIVYQLDFERERQLEVRQDKTDFFILIQILCKFFF